MKALKWTAVWLGGGMLMAGMAGTAVAQDFQEDPSECATDADCDDGETCEVTGGSACADAPPCVDGEECPEPPDCEEQEFRSCVRAPIDCEEDSDCPDFLVCESLTSSVPCTVDENGDEICGEPEPEESFCAYEPIDCAADSDCPSDFECISIGSGGCPDIAIGCPEGEDCPEPEPVDCDDEESFICVPRQIECETNSECPSEWSCETFESGECSGGGSVPGMGVEPDGEDEGGMGGQAEDPAPREEPEEDDCSIEVTSLCVPPGFEGIGGGGADLPGLAEERDSDSTNQPQAPGDDSNGGSSSNDDEEGGCSVSAPASNKSNPAAVFLMLGLMAAITLVRRR